MTVKGATERAASSKALAGDKHSHGHAFKAGNGPNDVPGLRHAIQDELESTQDDGDDPVARRNDGIAKGGDAIAPTGQDATETDPWVTSAKYHAKEDLGMDIGNTGNTPGAASKSTEAKGYNV